MSTIAASPIVAAAGGSFLLETRTPAEVFTPEDLTEEQRQIAATAARLPAKRSCRWRRRSKPRSRACWPG